MKSDIEQMNNSDNARIASLEIRAAELERMLVSVAPETTLPGHDGYANPGVFQAPAASVFGGTGEGMTAGPDGRTEALINGGRSNGAPSRTDFFRSHWRALSITAGAVAVAAITVTAVSGGGGTQAKPWPASVTRMQAQITTACQNPDVAAEPSQVNFACAAGTRQVLWVFALLTSGGNPGYVDPVTGRRGLEPITPAQGGDVAWSLNLHQPYDPANPVDSIEVAARAVNNIAGGATLTNSAGQPTVQAGLESKAANCQRYTGSPALTSRPGYPALCARPLTPGGEQALVSDVFRQWMTNAPAQTATDAGILFAHAGDASSPQVQKILSSLPGSGL